MTKVIRLQDKTYKKLGRLGFVDQSYIYQAGALILNQLESSIVYGMPSFFVTTWGENMSFTIVNISGLSGKTFVSGYGTYPIYTKCINSEHSYNIINNVTNITVVTEYPNAWKMIFNNSLVSYTYNGIEYSFDESYSDRIIIEFSDDEGDYYTLSVKEVKISAQIAFGLVG